MLGGTLFSFLAGFLVSMLYYVEWASRNWRISRTSERVRWFRTLMIIVFMVLMVPSSDQSSNADHNSLKTPILYLSISMWPIMSVLWQVRTLCCAFTDLSMWRPGAVGAHDRFILYSGLGWQGHQNSGAHGRAVVSHRLATNTPHP